MPKQRETNYFNSELKKEFPFLQETRIDSEVYCLKCKSKFSIQNSGKSAVINRTKTNKHKTAVEASATTSKGTEYFKQKSFQESDLKRAASEGLFAYHTVQHNQSFNSMSCTSAIIKRLYDKQFSCSKTKATAIIQNVLFPRQLQSLQNSLNDSKFVTAYFDASNHLDTKMIPIMVRYFSPKTGMQTKLLRLESKEGETSDILCEYIQKTLNEHSVSAKLVAICADNTKTNFGGKRRAGENNVYTKLQQYLKRPIIGVGCSAHIVHNAIQTAVDRLPVDIECVVVKIHSYFKRFTVRVENLKSFCEFCQTEYEKVLGYSNTRFLALLPAVERIIKMFEPLKSYFLSNQMVPLKIVDFFENPEAELWLYYIQHVASMFQETILELEGQKITVTGVTKAIKSLRDKLDARLLNKFVPLLVLSEFLKHREDQSIDENRVIQSISSFYQTSLQYLTEWTEHYNDFAHYTWIDLKKSLPEWSMLEQALPYVSKNLSNVGSWMDENKLFDEWTCAMKFVDESKLAEWNTKSVDTDQRWVEMFSHFTKEEVPFTNLATVVVFLMALPGSNAVTERIF